MIDPLLPNATIKTRLLENILEIINSKDEKFLDISIVCRDGSFLWSQFLLAAASDLFATAMQGVEVTQVIFPDLQVEDVRGSLRGLLHNTPPTETEQGNHFINFLSPTDFCIDAECVKTEIDEGISGEDLDLNGGKPINNEDINFLQLEPLEQSWVEATTERVMEQSTGKQNNIKTEDDSWNMGEGLQEHIQLGDTLYKVSPMVGLVLSNKNAVKNVKSRSILRVNQNNTKPEKLTNFKRCGACSTCVNYYTITDCDACHYCLDKKRNGGPDKLKKACINRICELTRNRKISEEEKKEHILAKLNCDCCEYTGPTVRSVKDHKKDKHPGEFLAIPQEGEGDLKFSCDFCSDFFRKKDDVLNHVRTYHEDYYQPWVDLLRQETKGIESKIEKKEYKGNYGTDSCRCNMCEYICTNKLLLKEHIKINHSGEFLDIPEMDYINGSKKLKCVFCKDIFTSKGRTIDHVRLEHKDDFKSWIDSIKKKRIYKPLTPSQLLVRKEENKKRYANKSDSFKLLKHFYKKDGIFFKCKFCDETFQVLSNFKKHMSTVHKDLYGKELEFICDVCGDGFLRKGALNNHSLVHLPPVSCPQCDKVFSTKICLGKHIRLNCKTEVALKFCELCGKGFKTDYTLKVHNNRVHLNHRPFKCTICSNAFKTLIHFQTHCTGKHNIEREKCKQYLLMVNPEAEKIAE